MPSSLVAILLTAAVSAAAAGAAELRAGRAAVKLALPAGLPLGGGGGDDKPASAEGLLDELLVRALVLEAGETRLGIAICDLHSVDAALVASVRKALGPAAPSALVVAATGSREAPTTVPASSAAVRAQVAARVVEAVKLASSSLQPAALSVGSGVENSAAFYNRFLLKDGTVRANPGKLNPEIVQPAGEADPDLLLLRVDAAAGQPLARLGAYALRPAVTGGAKYSADYPGVIANLIARLHGGEVVTLWSAAAGANVSHVDVHDKAPQSGPAEARRTGTILAAEALKAEVRARPVSFSRLLWSHEAVRLAPRAPGVACPSEAEVAAAGFGEELAIVALPGELWTELGTAIRRASPFRHTLLIGGANGWAGVLPTRRGYSDGALEPDVLCAAGSGEAVAEAAARALAELRRNAALR